MLRVSTTLFFRSSSAAAAAARFHPTSTSTRMSSTAASWKPPAPDAIPAPPQPRKYDQHSFANITQIHPEHIHLDWVVDWQRRILSGSALHTIGFDEDGVSSIVLDSSFLDLGKITVDGKEVKADVSPRKGTLGSALTIPLDAPRNKGDSVKVKIEYSTTQQSTALGWLTKEQTLSKKGPFLYSQCQAIHARSLLPCIDSPSHRCTYTATVKSDQLVLMSALKDDEAHKESTPHDPNTYHFKQPQRIPSYLIAIISAVLEFRPLGARVGVWAEPGMADRAQWEFEEDAERFLKASEETVSPYSWGRYDCIVLPQSFPYGGMENPNAVTLTPALIVGNRMQVDVLLHELMHSWSGNLTTSAAWTEFALNEGWCVYLERLVLQVVHGKEEGPAYRGFSYIIGSKALKDAREGYKNNPRFQRLVPVFEAGEDPDDAFSSIPYEAGSNLLLYLENVVGGLENFLPYVRAYFHTYHDRTITIEEWKAHFLAYFSSSPEITQAIKEKVDWEAWLHGEGIDLPVDMTPYYDDTLARAAWALADRWAAFDAHTGKGFGKHDISGFNASQLVVFLEKLHSGPDVPPAVVKKLDETYSLSDSKDGEVLLRFYEVALEVEGGEFARKAADWVKTVGRMKYVRPIYRALYKVDRELAIATFQEAKDFYHPIARSVVEKDLKLA
ncbi:Leucyl aminopeptidase yscIV [Tilletia horrida]|uniref:Leucyl aminopeptidase yscIV n=1 Tax=Tilletia horrida TaxID=155126 RepID=A0AAN6JL27_9BASI|nr:Leucyl aminopeptidase yscIV [Tilletia horrida]KAK0538210.1 Leucyl aminopeptidase yscIV [Tilletia horrida]KAK0540584.1 Leucyl aminopeptidase yscIV [Tilletia horrida]KAK0566485.1 Leucyl aminopeptidase yscIV [Tilletia horrida]